VFQGFFMTVYYPTKARYRITLDLEVMDDFSPHNVDWEKLLDIQGSEKVISYVEDLTNPDKYYS